MAEEVKPTEPVQGPPTPPAAAAPSITDQYELGDTALSESVVTPITSPAPEPPPAGEQSAEAPPRDRDEKGRFLPKPPELSQPKHSKYLLRLATDLGVSEEDIASSSTEHLEELVYHLNRQHQAGQRDLQRQEAMERKDRSALTVEPPEVGMPMIVSAPSE